MGTNNKRKIIIFLLTVSFQFKTIHLNFHLQIINFFGLCARMNERRAQKKVDCKCPSVLDDEEEGTRSSKKGGK